MGFTSYTFYTTEYMGELVEQASFDKWNKKASMKLQYLIGGRIDESQTTFSNEVQLATCAIIDCLINIEDAIKHSTDPTKGAIKSMSSGGQSVTFDNTETIYTSVMNDIKAQDALMRNVIYEYLYNTDLLYEGV